MITQKRFRLQNRIVVDYIRKRRYRRMLCHIMSDSAQALSVERMLVEDQGPDNRKVDKSWAITISLRQVMERTPMQTLHDDTRVVHVHPVPFQDPSARHTQRRGLGVQSSAVSLLLFMSIQYLFRSRNIVLSSLLTLVHVHPGPVYPSCREERSRNIVLSSLVTLVHIHPGPVCPSRKEGWSRNIVLSSLLSLTRPPIAPREVLGTSFSAVFLMFFL